MFDGSRFYLGKICKRGHNHEELGKSLRRISNHQCVLCSSMYSKQYYSGPSREHVLFIKRKYRLRPDCIIKKKIWSKQYRSNPEIKKLRNEKLKIKRLSDPSFKLINNYRCRINNALHSQSAQKSARIIQYLGISISDYKHYLESKFLPGMSWFSYGYGQDKWNIDHIKALANFNLTDPVQQKLAFHYTNTQPLWQPDNLRKTKSTFIFNNR